MYLRIRRTDGKTGVYRQEVDRRRAMLHSRFDPNTMYCSGPIVIGTHNPLSILNPDEVCWVEVETAGPMKQSMPDNVEKIRKLSGREEYESLLARQWPLWQKQAKKKPDQFLEAFVELSFRGGDSLFLHVAGHESDTSLVDSIFGLPAVTATYDPDGTVFINPKCIVRARIYHSKDQVAYPSGIWVAEADDI